VYNQHPRQKTHRVHLSKAAIFAARSYPFHQDVSPVGPTTHHCYGAARLKLEKFFNLLLEESEYSEGSSSFYLLLVALKA
jgi:hypothetical protein